MAVLTDTKNYVTLILIKSSVNLESRSVKASGFFWLSKNFSQTLENALTTQILTDLTKCAKLQIVNYEINSVLKEFLG